MGNIQERSTRKQNVGLLKYNGCGINLHFSLFLPRFHHSSNEGSREITDYNTSFELHSTFQGMMYGTAFHILGLAIQICCYILRIASPKVAMAEYWW